MFVGEQHELQIAASDDFLLQLVQGIIVKLEMCGS
jgi:hypothetical protein